MTMLTGSRRALLGPRRLRYLLRATFNAPNQGYADAQVLDTDAEGIQDGQLTVVEVDGTLAIVSNQMAFTAQGTPTWGDLGGHWQAITRALGRGLLTGFNLSTWEEMGVAWHDAAAVVDPDNTKHAWQANATDGQLDNRGGVAIWTGLSTSTDYKLALLLGGFDVNGVPYYAGQTKATYVYGCWYFLHDGVQWHLAWLDSTDNTATLYAMISNLDAVGTLTLDGSDPFIVPDKDLSAIQVPAAYSSFTAPNGTSLDAITPEVGGGWTHGTGSAFDIQGNKVHALTDPGGTGVVAWAPTGCSDLIVDGLVEVDAGDAGYIGCRFSDTTHFWIVGISEPGDKIIISNVDGGGITERASAAVTINPNTQYAVRLVADGQTIDGFMDGANKITYAVATVNETVSTAMLRFNDASAGNLIDNFTVYPRTNAQFEAVLGSV